MILETIHVIDSMFFQIAVFFLTSAIVGYLFFLKFHRFNSHNPPPGIHGILPILIMEDQRPPPVVSCGIYIDEFSEFSIITNQFVADFFVWFLFHPSRIDKGVVENFAIEKAYILSKEKKEVKFSDDKLFVQYKIRARFSSTMFFKDFPFDDHRLYLTIINDNLTPSEMHFEASEQAVRFNPQLNISGWKLINVGVKPGYKEALLDMRNSEIISYPCVTFSFDFKRNGIRQALIVILPMLGMFFISYSSITLNFTETAPKLIVTNISLGSIMGLLAYRFVLETITPKVGYFTLTDHMFFVFLTVSFLVFLLKLYTALGSLSPELIAEINATGVIAIPIALIFLIFIALNGDRIFRGKR